MSSPAYEDLPCSSCLARVGGLCSAMPEEAMHRLYALAVEQQHEAGQVLLRQEQLADYVFSIQSGYGTLFRLTAEGKRQILVFLFPGDFFGFTSEDRYHYSVGSISPMSTCRFDRRALERLIEDFPRMDRKLRFTFTRALDAFYELTFSLGRKDAVQKVASFLWYVGYRQRKLLQPDNPVHLPMRRVDIADFMGLTTETVSRAITSLKQMDAIRLRGAYDVEVVDMDRLRSIGIVVSEPAPFLHGDMDYYPHKQE